MNHDINVVYDHPLCTGVPFLVIRRLIGSLPHMIVHKIGNGLDLGGTASLTYN